MMGNALDRAFARADTMRVSAREASVSRTRRSGAMYGYGPVATDAERVFDQGTTSEPWAYAEQGQNLEQLRHFKDWVYVCVNAIANRMAAQPIRIGNVRAKRRRNHDAIAPLDTHPFLEVVHDPNPLMVGWSLMYLTAASLKLCGKAFWWMPGNAGSVPTEIWPLPPSWVRPLDKFRTMYQVTPIVESLAPFQVRGERMAFFNVPHPYDPIGLSASPLASQAAAVSADESLQIAQAEMFENGMFPALGITTGDVTDTEGQDRLPLLDNDQRDIIYDAMKKMFNGPGKAGAWIIFDALIKDIKKLSLSPEEMGFLESGQLTKSRIFQAFGVNPLIVGEIQGANRAQATVAEESFCSNVINPLTTLVSQVLMRRVAPLFAQNGEKLAIWLEQARAHDPETKLKEWETGLKTNAVDRNEYRTAVLGLQPKPKYERLLISSNLVPDDD